jgi:hypothetical protein
MGTFRREIAEGRHRDSGAMTLDALRRLMLRATDPHEEVPLICVPRTCELRDVVL